MNVGFYNKTSIDSSVNLGFYNKTFIDTSLNNYATKAGPSFTGRIISAGDLSLNSRLSVSNDVSMNGKLYLGNHVSIETIDSTFELNVNGTARVNVANATNNKLLVLSDNSPTDNISTAINFYGFGINSSTLRYQVPVNNVHSFYNGSTEALRITDTIIVNNDLSNNGNVTLGKYAKINRISEQIIPNATSTSPYTLDLNTGAVFFLSSPPAANFTCNFTNYPISTTLDANRSFVVTLIIDSATNKRYCNTVQVGGAATTLIYNGGSAAVSVSSATVITQTLVFVNVSGSYPWRVMTSISSYQ
jgi:hypothetical protein